MTRYCQHWCCRLGLASWLVISGAIAFSGNNTLAQLTPDTTLGSENSTVTSTGAVDSINGGATRGTNLFHSFGEFNVEEGRAAYFNNPAGIENILSRITGANPSNIFGTLGVVGGNANLFLINPNGIIFGANARLDVGGSFVGTTANAIGFGNQGFFSATNPSNPSLLTVNPSALLFNQIRAASIKNNSVADSGLNPSSEFTATGLRVPDGKSLLFVGSDLNLNGGGLYAFGGRVELGGLAGTGTVGLNGDGNNLSLSFPDNVEKSDVSLSNGARANVRAGNGGSIAINAQNLEMTERSSLYAGIESGLGSDNSKAGNISVNATGAINLNNRSSIANQVLAEANGQGGDVSISASTLKVEGGAQIGATTLGGGKAGNLKVIADTVQLAGRANDRVGSVLSAQADLNSTGDAGNLTINTRQLLVRDGAQISTGTFGTGKAGDLTVNATDSVQLIGSFAGDRIPIPSGLFTEAVQNLSKDAGNLTINTRQLLVRDGAVVSSATFGTGKAADLTVNATDSVQLIGTSIYGPFSSSLTAQADLNSTGDAGDLTINTRQLLVRDGAEGSSTTFGAGKGGDLTVNATDFVQLIGESTDGQFGSSLTATTRQVATGNAGSLTINTDELLIQDGAEATVSSFGEGVAGNFGITARSVRLDKGKVIAQARSGNGGSLKLDIADLLLMRHGSEISTTAGTAQKGGNGGNIDLDSEFIIAVPEENSDITANAFSGSGGKVRINATGVFGIAPISRKDLERLRPNDLDPRHLPTNEIIAISQQNPSLSGTVDLNTPNIEPNSGLVSLPVVPVDTQVSQACTPGGSQQQSEFVVTGRGGLPQNPGEALNTDAIQVDLVTLAPEVNQSTTTAVSTSPTSPTPTPIVEAQGWAIAANGEVILTANANTVTPHNSWQNTANCRS
jgi:filamentous hemagglutinin family protein